MNCLLNTRIKFSSILTSLYFLLVNGSAVQIAFAQQKIEISDKGDVVKAINQLYHDGLLNQGKVLAQTNLRKYPKDSELQMLLGKYYVLSKNYDKARYELSKSIESNPGNVAAKHMLVTVETETKRYSSAICYINELLEVNPYWRGLWRKKIELYRLQGNHVEADRLLKRIAQIFPEDGQLKADLNYQLEEKAVDLKKQGKINQTISIREVMLEESVNNISAYLDLIDNYIKVGDYQEALKVSERGLHVFPGNKSLVDKKISILEHGHHYDEILSFIQDQERYGKTAHLQGKQSYFLLQAARYSKDRDPGVLYGKILNSDPNNQEAFEFVFNDLIAHQQYDEALLKLQGFILLKGYSKGLMAKELNLYRLKNDEKKVTQLTKTMYLNYSKDLDLRNSYVQLLTKEIKGHLLAEEYADAEFKLNQILPICSSEQLPEAQQALYQTYFRSAQYDKAIDLLDKQIIYDPKNMELYLKKSEILALQGKNDYALSVYEFVLQESQQDMRNHYLTGYSELMTQLVKTSIVEYQYLAGLKQVDRWLNFAPNEKQALLYGINLASLTKNQELTLKYAQIAAQQYPYDSQFKIKLASSMQFSGDRQAEAWSMLKTELERNPYNELLINSFVQLSNDYARQLLRDKMGQEVLQVSSLGLNFSSNNRELKYLKGLAYEQLKQYDSAFFYQSFYEPSLLELKDFQQHLNYLSGRRAQNELNIHHLRARFGDDYAIQSISTLEYIRHHGDDIFVGRVNYSGRQQGVGIQGQIEWGRSWNKNWGTRFDFGLAGQYFPKVVVNGFLIRQLQNNWEVEAGIGYRSLYTEDKLYSFSTGTSKELGPFRLQGKLVQFFLQNKWLYNVGIQGKYHMSVNPKNYILAMANVGSSPDVELLNYQYINSISILNSMVGAGIGRTISKNVSASMIGTYYNFQSSATNLNYRNLYNLYLQLHVTF